MPNSGSSIIVPRFNRRQLLTLISTWSLTGLAGCGQQQVDGLPNTSPTAIPTDTRTSTATPEERWEINPLEHDKLIGAHYYPWYRTNPAFDPWAQKTPRTPVLGEYDSSNENVINQHIKWAREAGINWFNVSWWGINSPEDRTLRNHVLEAELGDQIDFSILYESTGQLGRSPNLNDDSAKQQLRDDFRYIEETYFDYSNYLRIDGRPVIYVYAVNTFTGDIGGALELAQSSIDSDPYLLASISNIDPSRRRMTLFEEWMSVFDAIAPYSIYHGESLFSYREFSGSELTLKEYTTYSANSFRNALLAADLTNIAVIPTVLPGGDNTHTPGGDSPIIERSPPVFREMCAEHVDLLDPSLDAMFITSFNEWPETTAIEPAEYWGETYLEIIAEEVADGDSQYLDPSIYDTLRLDFNQTIKPEGSHRELALMGNRLKLMRNNGSLIDEFDIGVPEKEPILIEGAYPTEETDSWGRFRWFGGPTERASIFFHPDVETPNTVEWTGLPMRSDVIEAEISFNGKVTNHVTFGERGPPETYTISV